MRTDIKCSPSSDTTLNDPVSLWTHPPIISSVFKCIIGVNICGSWQNLHIDSLACGIGDIIVEKVKKVNKKHYHTLGNAEISTTHKDLSEAGPWSPSYPYLIHLL